MLEKAVDSIQITTRKIRLKRQVNPHKQFSPCKVSFVTQLLETQNIFYLASGSSSLGRSQNFSARNQPTNVYILVESSDLRLGKYVCWPVQNLDRIYYPLPQRRRIWWFWREPWCNTFKTGSLESNNFFFPGSTDPMELKRMKKTTSFFGGRDN